MAPIQVSLHHTQLTKIKNIFKYEEPRVIRRANILNCLHLGYTSGTISDILNISPRTVQNVGSTFLELGLDAALYDNERSGRPIDIDDRERSRIIAMVCAEPPSGFYRWTLDLIVEEVSRQGLVSKGSISREQIRIILNEHDLKPWQEKMWCIEEITPKYIERMEDVLEVYEGKYDGKRPVICIDEKPVPLLGDGRDRIPAAPGSTKKIDYEYTRNGTANVFCGVEPSVGRYFNKVTETRDGHEFASFLSDIYRSYEDAEKIILFMDNLSTHTEKSVIGLLGESDGKQLWEKFEIHYGCSCKLA